MTKLSIRLAGENDRNITEDDVMERFKVSDVALTETVPLCETDPIREVVRRFSDNDNMAYPVVNADGKLTGILTLTHLKDILLDSDVWAWMVVADVLVHDEEYVSETTPLRDALERMTDVGLEQLPVVAEVDKKVTGVLDMRHARKVIQQEMIRLQTQAVA